MRTRRRKPEKSIEELLPRFVEDGHFAQPPTEWRPTPADDLEREQIRRLVQRQIELLPESFRSVILLRDVEGQDTEATAALLGISSAAVKTRLHRARLALRHLLDPHFRKEAA